MPGVHGRQSARGLPPAARLRLLWALSDAIEAAPGGIRGALGKGTEQGGRRLLWALAGALGARSLEIGGRQGSIEGLVQDRDVFGRYVEEGSWDAEVCDLVAQIFHGQPTGTFLDIGANIGLTLIPVAQHTTVRCYGFEPEPRNFALLARNIERNVSGDNVRLFNLALLDEDGTVDFELSERNFGDHRVRSVGRAASEVFREDQRRLIQVPSRRLDGLLTPADLPRPVVAKIDAQGAEQQIYAGGCGILGSADVLVMEYWPYGIERMGGDTDRLVQAIEKDFRFGCFLVKRRVPRPEDLMAIGDLAGQMTKIAARKGITAEDINTHDVVLTKSRSSLGGAAR